MNIYDDQYCIKCINLSFTCHDEPISTSITRPHELGLILNLNRFRFSLRQRFVESIHEVHDH